MSLETFKVAKDFAKDYAKGKVKTISQVVEVLAKEAVQRALQVREAAGQVASQPREIPVRVKRLHNFGGDLPKYESSGASGFDVRAQLDVSVVLQPGERFLVPTGLSFEIPEGFEIQARPRSGLAIKQGLSLVNTPGTIDADYRGEVKIIAINLGSEAIEIKPQDRIAQLVVCPVFQARFEDVDSLGDTVRGDGGFGSTGKS